MQATVAHTLVLAVLLGWMTVSSPLLVGARDTRWWHPMFGGGNTGDVASPDKLATTAKFSATGSGSSDSSSSTYAEATSPRAGDDAGGGGAAGGGGNRGAGGEGGDSSGGGGSVRDAYSDPGDSGGAGGADGADSGSGESSGNGVDRDADGGVSEWDSSSSSRNIKTAASRRSDSNSDDDDGDDGDEGTAEEVPDRDIVSDSNGTGGDGDARGGSPATDTAAAAATKPAPRGGDPSLINDWEPEESAPDCPRFNLTSLPRTCSVMRRVCMHQETLVTHDWRYSYANPRREPLPEMPWVENWNFPAAVGTNTDALKGRAPRYRLHLRQASSFEPTEALRNPVFSNCTLPLMLVVDFPFNMGEFFAKMVSAVDRLGMDDRATLVLQTPMGLGLAAFHSLLLMSYSRYPLITAAELGDPGCAATDPRVGSSSSSSQAGRRGSGSGSGGGGGAVPWSPDPVQPHCFQRMILCKWDLQSGGGAPLAMVASRVTSAIVGAGLLPPSPVRFPGGDGGGGGARGGANPDPDPRGTSTLRVLIETRQGPVRNIKNMQALLAACKELDRSGFTAGPFRRLACATTSFAAPDGSVDRQQFLANMAAVRSSHVLVVLHGAGATNSWFMRQGSSAVVELRPCGFGTHFGPWPDKYLPKQHEKNDDVVRFFALNVEDPGQCLQGDIETSLRNHTAKRDSIGWDAGYFARDQHLQLKPAPFLEFIRHAGELLLDVNAYRDAREADRLHGYVVPEGLMYGKLGIPKLAEFRAAEKPVVIPFP